MKFRVHNSYTEVIDPQFLELKAMKDYLTYEEYVFNPFMRQMVKKRVSFYDEDNSRFPTGCIWEILKVATPKEIEDVRTNRIEPICTPEEACIQLGIDYRDYQIEATKTALKCQRGILNIATNGGKTEIMAMCLLCYPKVLTVVIAPDLTSLSEITERFELRGIEHSVIDAQHKDVNWDGINVCSIDSLMNLPEKSDLLKKCKILIWDECDFSSTSTSGMSVFEDCDAYVRIYLSGTPFTDDQYQNYQIVNLSGGELVKISNHYLIERGFSARPVVHFHSSLKEPLKRGERESNYQAAEKQFITENEEFCEKVCNLIETFVDEGVVVLFEKVKHGRKISDCLKSRGIRNTYLDGGSWKSAREDAKRHLINGTIQVIVASSIWNRSLDFGFPQRWVYVGGLKASNRIKQRYGRALRKKPNDDNVVHIHDFYIWGNTNIENHSYERYKICLDEKFEVKVEDHFLYSVLQKKEKKEKKEVGNPFELMQSQVNRLVKKYGN